MTSSVFSRKLTTENRRRDRKEDDNGAGSKVEGPEFVVVFALVSTPALELSPLFSSSARSVPFSGSNIREYL